MRKLHALAGAILGGLDDAPAARHAAGGRLSSAPERRLRAARARARAVHGVRGKRLPMGQPNDNPRFRWFAGLNVDDAAWDHSMFSFNRERSFDTAIAQQLFDHTAALTKMGELASDTHDLLIAVLKQRGIKPHIARHTSGRRSAIAGRAARDKGCAMSLQRRTRNSDHWWATQAAPRARVSGARPGDVDIRCLHPDPASRARVNPDWRRASAAGKNRFFRPVTHRNSLRIDRNKRWSTTEKETPSTTT
ncbi:transposase [Metallibacterium sp.]